MPHTSSTNARVAALLNDLLKLDHDALGAYTLAIHGASDPLHRETLEAFRADHQRHIEDLVPLVESYGGNPIRMPHVPTGQFKLAVQTAGNAGGGDRSVLMAFKANERQVRDKYVRLSAEDLPPDVAEVIARNATDEVRHYAWASEAMEAMGAGEGTLVGRAEGAFEQVHARTADAIEFAERRALEQVQRARDGVRFAAPAARSGGLLAQVERLTRDSPAAALALGLAAGLALRRILR